MRTKTAILFSSALAILLMSCEPEMKGHGAVSHDSPPEHGGQMVHLKVHGPMMEVVCDEKAGTIVLHIYTDHHEPLTLTEAPVANIEKGPTQVTATGAGAVWTFTHENLKDHPHVGFRVKVGDETFNNKEWELPH